MKRISNFTDVDIVNYYQSTKSTAAVAKKYNVDFNKTKKILKRNGIETSKRKHPLNIDYFKKIDSEEKAYWLGFIQSDGCIKKCGYKLTFCMGEDDLLIKFRKAIGAGSPVSHRGVYDKRTGKTYMSYSLQICSKEFCEYIRSHGINENKSTLAKFPDIKEEFYSHFVRGLFDGDGHFFTKTTPVRKYRVGRVGIISTESCLVFIQEFLLKAGICKSFITKWDFSFPVFTLHIINGLIPFLDWMYKDSTNETRLERKYNKFIEEKPLLRDKVIEIKNLATGEVFKTKNLQAFCDERGLNSSTLNSRFHKNTGILPGNKHSDWMVLSMKDQG